MKKKLLLIITLFILITCTACGSIAETDYATPKEGLIIDFYENEFDYNGLRKFTSEFYKIEIYADRTMKYGIVKEGLKERKLSVGQYNKIIKIAYSDAFFEEFFSDIEIDPDSEEEPVLEKNISGKETELGIDSRIVIYSGNSSAITVGGENPDNAIYNKLIKTIKKYAK